MPALLLSQDVHEKVDSRVKADGKNWEDLCAFRDGITNACFVDGAIGFFSGNRTYYDETVKSVSDLRTAISAEEFPDGRKVNRGLIFGKYDVDDDTDKIKSARGLALYYRIDNKPLARAEEWEASFLDEMEGESNDDVSVFYIADRSLSDVFGDAIRGDVVLTSITYILMIIITCVVFTKRCSLVETRIALALAGIGIVILAMLAGYGLSSGFGIPFVPLHQVLPFLVVGIGVDDMFIIVASFDAQTHLDPDAPVSERLARAFRRCGVSITYTTATDVIAFFLGATSTLPAIQAFCFYAAFSILFNFCFQITIFSALLCEDTLRIERGHYDFIGCCYCSCICGSSTKRNGSVGSENSIATSSEAEVGEKDGGAVPVAGNFQEHNGEGPLTEERKSDQADDIDNANLAPVTAEPNGSYTKVSSESNGVAADPTKSHLQTPSSSPPKQQHDFMHDQDDEKNWNVMQKFFAYYYYPTIIRSEVRVFIVIGFLTILAVGIWGATEMELGFDQTDFAPDDSYVSLYFDKADQLGLLATEQNLPVSIYYKDIDYYKEDTQKEILNLQDEFLKGRYNDGPFNSWIESFIDWVPTNSSPYSANVSSNGYLTDKDTFYEAVEYFVNLDEYDRFESDVIFEGDSDDNSLYIKSSRTSAFPRRPHLCRAPGGGDAGRPRYSGRLLHQPRSDCVRAWLHIFRDVPGDRAGVDIQLELRPGGVWCWCPLFCAHQTHSCAAGGTACGLH